MPVHAGGFLNIVFVYIIINFMYVYYKFYVIVLFVQIYLKRVIKNLQMTARLLFSWIHQIELFIALISHLWIVKALIYCLCI